MRRSALSVALGLCFAAGVQAQNVTGSIFGEAGAGGGSVIVENMGTGARFTITPDASGRYTASTLPAGRYRVTLQRDGTKIVDRDNVQVLVGRGTKVDLLGDSGTGSAGDAATLEAVTVYGGGGLHQIDVSQIESKMVITKEELDRLPVAPNITAIALLAPGVVEGDSRYPQAPTISGSSASENAYYINGYPVKNPLSNVGYTQLPFNAIDQVQVSTSGYGVEFGRSTGGVVNIITSRGSNEWEAGGQVIWRPEGVAGNPRNLYFGPDNQRSGLAFGNAGQIRQYRKENKADQLTTSVYIGGPIIRDRLFFYAAGEMIREEGQGTRTFATSVPAVSVGRQTGWNEYVERTPRWLGKLDWHITDNHHLELTGFSDRVKRSEDHSGFDYADFSRNGIVVSGIYDDDKTDTYVANYTGYLSDALTVSAMYGESKVEHIDDVSGYDPTCPTITVDPGGAVPGLTYGSCQTYTGIVEEPASDETSARRFDLEYRIGDHTLKAGYDYTDAETDNNVDNFAGGFRWLYSRLTDPNEPVFPRDGVGSPASGGGFGTQGYYVEREISSFASQSRVEQEALYLKDVWQVTDNVLLELGLRSESFANFNSGGQAFVEKENQLAPRLGASWDVRGDSSLKLFASAGRYHLALPNYISRRMADGAINTSEAFTYTGVDPATGVPTGLNALGPVYSVNGEFGQPKDPNTIAPTTLKSHAQDTFALGMEQRIRGFNVGAKFTYTNLVSAIDDFCDGRQGRAWALRNGFTTEQAEGLADHLSHCVMINPGEDNTYLWDMEGDGDYEQVDLSAEELGFPKLKRNYYALDLFLERPFDGKWYARVDYTFSKNWGNMEGQLNSDLGQVDVSSTVTSDYPELAENSSGYLPNHRRHQFRAHGYYQFAPEWLASVNMVWMSGRPRNCLGQYPDIDPQSPNYGSFHFFCDGVAVPRGTYGELPALYRWDFGLRYTPNWAKGLSFGANLFNAFNRQSVQNVVENYNQGQSATTRNANWGRVISYSTPRYLELSMRYDWGR